MGRQKGTWIKIDSDTTKFEHLWVNVNTGVVRHFSWLQEAETRKENK